MEKRENNRLSFGHVPDSLRPPKLKRGERVKFRVHGTYDPISGVGRLVSAIRIPYKDTIIDEEGEDIQIELLERIDAKGDPKHMFLWITDQMGGILVLHGGNAKDRRIYEYLMLCNYNASNPNRDTSVPKIVEVVDEVDNAKMRRSDKHRKREAFNIAVDMTDEEVRQYFASQGGNPNRDLHILREILENDAEEQPDKFLEGGFTQSKQIDGNLRLAGQKSIIVFDKESSSWQWPDKDVICEVSRGVGVSRYKELLDFITKAETGQRIYDKIKKELKAIG